MHSFGLDRTEDFFAFSRKVSSGFSEKKKVPRKILSEKPKSPIAKNAAEIAKTLREVRQLLASHRHEYVGATDPTRRLPGRATAGGPAGGMTDEQRDEIDAEAQRCVGQCASRIDALAAAVAGSTGRGRLSGHAAAHLDGLVAVLSLRVQGLSAYHADMRSLRLRLADEARHGYLRLAPLSSSSSPSSGAVRDGEPRASSSGGGGPGAASHAAAAVQPAAPAAAGDGNGHRTGTGGAGDESAAAAAAAEAVGLGLELEHENSLLLHELDTLLERSRQVERQLMEISELQQLFASKVSQQELAIERNYDAAVAATAHIDTGGRELKKATKKGVDFRLCVLMFLVVASLALLFLDSIT
eukprot:TRINITY_DN6996_c0_g1_i1.p1 TRINITY_DN6996_c0_g1~~TRINITY_DN6996_c0_g1_i1.p1  ORF type:complete len:356 (+),score=104.87 TRINITY_DN6996_c0_g1_i1:1093-2160(+)